MKILIICSNPVSSLFGKKIPFEGTDCAIAKEIPAAGLVGFDCVIDLEFEHHPERIRHYKSSSTPVLIGSVVYTLKELQAEQFSIARFNHWPLFISRNCIEFSSQQQQLFQDLFNQWQIPFYETADVPGFVSARTVSMIVNEAFMAKQENVSTISEIDTAMKLGTNYPLGPFEWCNELGEERIIQLLQKLTEQDNRYQPAESLLSYIANH
ncbi:MAG: 3-hydroxyacyl-CoA dehydrogenase family protein [Lacibacter sp.]